MEIKFENIEGNSIQYRLMMAAFALMAIVGLIATWWIIKCINCILV